MKHPYPDDADGDALRKVAESGADMSRPMVIEFSVDVPDERAARRVAEVVAPVGFYPSIFRHDETDSWSLRVHERATDTHNMAASLGEITGCDGMCACRPRRLHQLHLPRRRASGR